MNNTISKLIFGIGIVMTISALVAVFVNSISLNNSNLQTIGSLPPANRSNSSVNQTNVNDKTLNSSSTREPLIDISLGSAAQQVTKYYIPNPSEANSNSKVVWKNKDIAVHTATALDGSFDTGLIQPGSSGSALITQAGEIPYKCTIHPWMTGTITITGSNSNNSKSASNMLDSEPVSSNTERQGVSNQTSQVVSPTLNDTKLKVLPVVSGLKEPTTMEFLGSDDFLVLQKGGLVSRVTNGIIAEEPLLNVTVPTSLTQGMLGIALSNKTGSNITNVFLYYTEGKLNKTTEQGQENEITTIGNRVYRYDFVNDTLVKPKLLLSLPAIQDYMDNGGYLRIGPDGNLYMTVGAITGNSISNVQTLAQNFVNGTPVDGRAGILRITQDGDPVLDNNGSGLLGDMFPLNLYFGYGLKDSFGIDFDPLTGNLWDAEPGRFISDEINLIHPGYNGGFEVLQGQSIYIPAAPTGLVDFNGTGKYRDPEFVWTQKIVPVGLKFLNSDKLGENYKNDMFLGSYLNGNIYHFDLTEDRNHLVVPNSFINKQMATWNSTGSEEITFGKGFGSISSIQIGPDGFMYVISFSDGVIYKIMPA